MIEACKPVPITGRRQLNIVPEGEILSMSRSQYQSFLNENKIIRTGRDAEMLQRVGNKIASEVNKYLQNNGLANRLNEFNWEFNLVDSKEINAWCMPGGKVVFYTGILPYTKDEQGLAVVMGHEIAHAVARHGNERMSQGLLQQFGGAALSIMLQDKPAETQNLFLTAYGVGSTVGLMLPFSRQHESEADRLGLIFMSMAGYNPEEAIAFWTRFGAAKGAGAPPEFLSTHPSDQTRINQIKAYLPEAKKYAPK